MCVSKGSLSLNLTILRFAAQTTKGAQNELENEVDYDKNDGQEEIYVDVEVLEEVHVVIERDLVLDTKQHHIVQPVLKIHLAFTLSLQDLMVEVDTLAYS